MLSQLAIIKSYLDERSGKERKSRDRHMRTQIRIALFSRMRGHMFHSMSAKKEDKNARRMEETEITNFRYHMPFPRSRLRLQRWLFVCMVHHIIIFTSLSFALLQVEFFGNVVFAMRGLNEIVDNQQFVLFLFFLSTSFAVLFAECRSRNKKPTNDSNDNDTKRRSTVLKKEVMRRQKG